MLLLFSVWPGALPGGPWSGAGEIRQQRQQRFGPDDWLPEPGSSGLTA